MLVDFTTLTSQTIPGRVTQRHDNARMLAQKGGAEESSVVRSMFRAQGDIDVQGSRVDQLQAEIADLVDRLCHMTSSIRMSRPYR